MRVRLTSEAKDDLIRIADFIAESNPVRALSFIEELEQSCLAIGDMPNAFPFVARYERQGLRRRVHGDYLIFYRVETEHVTIIHILHGARDYVAILSGE
ncbi:type II toxin-antitoxin system RelE/ParE family toxin [Agrobacterium sp. SORGH_AS 787]|uniref:type II toxin-antitoxin system RelE/ParE family toxin n=1 Tax=Agrobacterium sp. SORGH_AS 787 TaxID=3041775 RepID=UPI00277F2D1D|nr:toxin ParE1/3/4 [Rhizobium sp. SORGH_AS_0787]